MISFRLRTKWQNCRGYVPRYERTPKNGWFDIHSVFATHVESVVLLSQQKADDYLEVEIDLDELDATSAETKATYEEIKKYVAEHNDGMKVSNLYIAQVKKKCGIELGQNFNLPKSENAKQPQCPKEKEDAIVEALKAFQMI